MLRFFFNFLLVSLILGILTVITVSLYVLPKLPDIETLKEIRMQVPLRVYSADLSLIAEFGEKRRTPVNIEEVNKQLINAFIAAEDDRFYSHPGVDWQGLMRAAYSLLKTGSKKQGGSTITMQVARNFFLSRERTYSRKLDEIFLALKIERELSKNAILELYLNKIYLGQRAYGVAAAAYVYYGTDINSLNLAQIAMIAGLPKAPSTTNPISNPKRAIARRDYVLQRMLTLGYISRREFNLASEKQVSASLHSTPIELDAPYIAEMVRKDLVNEHGEEAYNNGVIVTTTVKDRNQNAANQALRKALLDYDKRHGYRGPEHQIKLDKELTDAESTELLERFPVIAHLYPALVTAVHEQSMTAMLSGIGAVEVSWEGLKWARKYISENRRGAVPRTAAEIVGTGDIIRLQEAEDGSWHLAQIPKVEGALVSLNPNNGALLALVGGFDFYRNKFNRVTQAKRQPGSGFKPFIYSAALAAGKTAATIINDAPIVFNAAGVEDDWRPENYSRKNYGPTRMRQALIKSSNLVSVRLLRAIGIPFALEHIQKFGFDISHFPASLSLALGSNEITPLELARAYSVFANGGYLIEPYYIQQINTYKDEVIYKHTPLTVCQDCSAGDIIEDRSYTDETLDFINYPGKETAIDIEDSTSAPKTTKNSAEHAPRVVDARNIWIMNSITRDVIKRGTGRRALQLNRKDLSGKTGTTNDQNDAWFSGFNANVVAICWVGFDKFTPLGNGETGAKAALPMWIDYMRITLEGEPETIMVRPKGLVNIRIDPKTGKLANDANPKAIFEVFRTENVPQETEETRQQDIFRPDKETDSMPEQLF